MMSRSMTNLVRPAILAACLLSGTAIAANPAGEVRVGNTVRTYSAHVPDGPPPPGGFPLVLAFHGGGMQGEGMRRLTGLDAEADRRGFIVVYPNGQDKHWNDGRSTIRNPQDDIGFVAALIDQLKREQRIDRGRVYATGISNGALFAERLACDLSGEIAAIAAVAGTLPAELAPRCRPIHPVAVLQIDGSADPIMPFAGGAVADFGGRGEGGTVLSVAETMAFWASRNGCGAARGPQPLAPIAPLDRTRLLRTTYGMCAGGATMTLLTVIGGGHAWPGARQFAPRAIIGVASRQVDATREIVDFFLAQQRRL
jgi:polyhydroxybutyrate depolymerase